jgi:hypothetical protein
LLSVPKKKLFAPFFASISDGRAIPDELKAYVDSLSLA